MGQTAIWFLFKINIAKLILAAHSGKSSGEYKNTYYPVKQLIVVCCPV